MVLELVATAFLSVAFEKLFKRFSSTEFADFFRGKKSVDKKLKVLNDKLMTVSLLLDDAEDKQMVKPRVKQWLDDLKDVIFKVDDLVQEITEEARMKLSDSDKSGSRSVGIMMMKSLFTSLTAFDRTVEAAVTKFSEDLDILLNRALVLDLKHSNPQMERSRDDARLVALREESSVFGRDGDKETILNWLLSCDDWGNKIGVLPIVGMGGLGKTTLAQLVYNDAQVKEHQFELKAWVTVSTQFDVFEIIKNLLQQIGRPSGHTKELTVLQGEMKEALRGKKFLFVLDDIWDEDYHNWDLLMSSFAPGDSRSKIIVTTRSRKVCSKVTTGPVHELEIISEDNCWKIFAHHAFDGDLNADGELQEIGKRFVEKCKGFPLAVKVVGGLLHGETNPKKWEAILRSKVWETSGVLPSLWLSYKYLPSPLKQCFAYCAIFPQDYKFRRDEMVLLWMAEGFLLPTLDEKSLEEVGDEYFEVLISRSFFQTYGNYGSLYVMHDLVHDLATFVSAQFCLSLSRRTKITNITNKTRYLYCDGVKAFGEASSLHTYIESYRSTIETTVDEPIRHHDPTTDGFVQDILEAGRFLRVLTTPVNNISELLSSSRNNLKHLRYLNLSCSGIEEVPDSVCSIYSLQTLVLSGCRNLYKLPRNMGNLINLRHLNTSGSDGIKKMPPRMRNLIELRTLTDFALGEAYGDESFSSLKELGELPHLAGELRVYGLQNVEAADDAQKANFREKSNLVKLDLLWEGESSDTRREWEVLDALQPHTNLKELTIRGYAGSSFPKWVGDSSFSKMVSLTLWGSGSHDFCSSLPPLGQLASLEKLYIHSFNWVESLGSEYLGYFPRLKQLQLYFCSNLRVESLPDCESLEIFKSLNSMECFPLDKFPRLKNLQLNYCPKLKSITLSSREDHPLTFLAIRACPEMESFPQGGLPSSLKSLGISECRKLVEEDRHWDLHTLTSLTSLFITADSEPPPNSLDRFPQGLLPTSLTILSFCGFPNLKTLDNTAFDHLKSLQTLRVWDCSELESLPEQILPQSLLLLDIWECRFLETRYRKDKGDQWHCVSHIPHMDIRGHTTDELEEKEAIESESSSSLSSTMV